MLEQAVADLFVAWFITGMVVLVFIAAVIGYSEFIARQFSRKNDDVE